MIPRGGPLADDRPGLSARTLLFIAGIYFSVLTVVGFWLWQRWSGSFATRAVDDIRSLSGILFAALSSAWAARSARGRVRHGWRAMTAGLLGWANWRSHLELLRTRAGLRAEPVSVVG